MLDLKKKRLAIFASGSGSNAVAICEHFKNHPAIEVILVLSNNAFAPVLEKIKAFNVEAKSFSKSELKEGENLLGWLQQKEITHIVLAGFLLLVPNYLLESFPNAIINIHPALLPKFGGKGMYGLKIHEAVKAAAEKQSGITIHLVNEHFDEGRILFQATCEITDHDNAETIAQKVLALEHRHYPEQIEKWALRES
jgi:phosphoribosylglycinamide formyltransferase 1